jgi:hypothetical protein
MCQMQVEKIREGEFSVKLEKFVVTGDEINQSNCQFK